MFKKFWQLWLTLDPKLSKNFENFGRYLQPQLKGKEINFSKNRKMFKNFWHFWLTFRAKIFKTFWKFWLRFTAKIEWKKINFSKKSKNIQKVLKILVKIFKNFRFFEKYISFPFNFGCKSRTKFWKFFENFKPKTQTEFSKFFENFGSKSQPECFFYAVWRLR